jgi:hypothetical protein
MKQVSSHLPYMATRSSVGQPNGSQHSASANGALMFPRRWSAQKKVSMNDDSQYWHEIAQRAADYSAANMFPSSAWRTWFGRT